MGFKKHRPVGSLGAPVPVKVILITGMYGFGKVLKHVDMCLTCLSLKKYFLMLPENPTTSQIKVVHTYWQIRIGNGNAQAFFRIEKYS